MQGDWPESTKSLGWKLKYRSDMHEKSAEHLQSGSLEGLSHARAESRFSIWTLLDIHNRALLTVVAARCCVRSYQFEFYFKSVNPWILQSRTIFPSALIAATRSIGLQSCPKPSKWHNRGRHPCLLVLNIMCIRPCHMY